METIQITKQNAQKAYENGCDDVKTVLENLFGKELFVPKDITDRVKTFHDACSVLVVNPDDVIPDSVPAADSKSIVAYCQLIIIARALNEGWVPDWKNASEYKYYPWFDMSSGSGLSCFDYDDRYSFSPVGSRLCFKSRQLAEYAGKQFIDLYKDFFII
jgi:hypothetical protein